MTLVDSRGRPITSSASPKNVYKRAPAPTLGEAFGDWAGRDLQYLSLPGGGVLQFDLSRLTLADYRSMATHYQINSSLSVLAFMLHQLDFSVECSNPRIASAADDMLRFVWTRLVRAFSQAFWAGYSPNVLQWENDISGNRVILSKVKDLVPEECMVNWKEVEGALPPGAPLGARPQKLKIYDGIKKSGLTYPIPKENTLWYPLLMQNGDYYGRKLLKYAFQPWFFSTLIHLFSNRYFERFGEPVPVGRAPAEDQITVDGVTMDSNSYMLAQIQKIRSRAAVVLPSDRQSDNTGSLTDKFDYDIAYLESQMRGADFERYMTRLDEEISLALFTPLLLMRTADVGSYNLGVSHMQMYLWQLNAIADDWKEYIDRYVLSPFTDWNFGTKAPRPVIKFYKMGKTQAETNRAVLSSLISRDKVKVDLTELGQATGLTLEEIEEISEPPSQTPEGDGEDDREARVRDDKTRVADSIIARIAPQAHKAFSRGTFGNGWEPDIGHGSKLSSAQLGELEAWNNDLLSPELFSSADQYIRVFSAGVKAVLDVN